MVVGPYRLTPDPGFDGKPLLDVLTARFGEHVVAETRQAAADALRDGVSLDYGRAVAADTFEVHRLIARHRPVSWPSPWSSGCFGRTSPMA